MGKSSVFAMLSRRYTEISNYAGTSITVTKALLPIGELVDTPGIYNLHSEDNITKVTRQYAETADIVINVVSALTLERDLFLTEALRHTAKHLIVVINQVDEARRRGIHVSVKKLSNSLQAPVIQTVATRRVGRSALLQEILAHKQTVPGAPPCAVAAPLQKVEDCWHELPHRSVLSERLGVALLRPSIGVPVALIVLYLLFKILGVWVAGDLVDGLVGGIEKFYIPSVVRWVKNIPMPSLCTEALVGEFGVLTMTVKILCGVLLPLILGFYTVMAILEDSGYIPRLSVLTNKTFRHLGLNGSAVIPSLLGFGCGAVGTLSTRLLRTRKEQIIATILISLSVPCAAQQAIILPLLASAGSLTVWWLYLAIVAGITLLAGRILRWAVHDPAQTHFIIDIPPLRLPSLWNCARKTVRRTGDFLLESAPILAISSIVITGLNLLGFLTGLREVLSPIVERGLRLPRAFADILLMSIIRKDLASVGIFEMIGPHAAGPALTHVQVIVAAVVITLFVPCINALMIICKERGWQFAVALWCGTLFLSISLGMLLARVLPLSVA